MYIKYKLIPVGIIFVESIYLSYRNTDFNPTTTLEFRNMYNIKSQLSQIDIYI